MCRQSKSNYHQYLLNDILYLNLSGRNMDYLPFNFSTASTSISIGSYQIHTHTDLVIFVSICTYSFINENFKKPIEIPYKNAPTWLSADLLFFTLRWSLAIYNCIQFKRIDQSSSRSFIRLLMVFWFNLSILCVNDLLLSAYTIHRHHRQSIHFELSL